jgi:Rieske Fe-S protein
VRTAPYREGERLLIVTGEHFTPGTGAVTERYERLTGWLRERFPSAGEVAYRWAAQDTTSTDRVPFVGPLHVGARHVHVATGFGGWGMSTGVMAGHLLARSIAGERLPWADLYDPRRLNLRREASSMAKLQTKVAGHFIGDRLHRSGSSVADLAPGTGAVVKVDGDRCAVYRDDDGSLHALSARCTHLGCLVGFNDAERAWECPCHGSRFAVDGTVIQGPANRPLERKELPAAVR